MRQVHAVDVAGRRVAVEHEGRALGEFDAAVGELADPQLRALQIDQDADRAAIVGFERADHADALAHRVVASRGSC